MHKKLVNFYRESEQKIIWERKIQVENNLELNQVIIKTNELSMLSDIF